MKSRLALLLPVACIALIATQVQGATVSFFGPDYSNVTLDPSVGTAGGTISAYTVEATSDYFEPIDIYMKVAADPGQYLTAGVYTITETITNSTGLTWLDFKWDLLDSPVTFLTGPGDVAFTGFTTLDTATDGLLRIHGGTLASGGSLSITYQVAVGSSTESFTVKRSDVFAAPVPAPGSGVALMGLVMMLGVGRGIRRRTA